LIGIEDATWYYDKAERVYLAFNSSDLVEFFKGWTIEWRDFFKREFEGRDNVKLLVFDDGKASIDEAK